MKKLLYTFVFIFACISIHAQVTTLAPDNFVIIDIGTHSYGAYSRSVILLHEIYDGQYLTKNYAVGTLYAFRGSAGSNNRTNIAEINTSSAYSQTYGSLRCTESDNKWTLKTVSYNQKKYLAVKVPVRNDEHSLGFHFMGRSYSTGERMKLVVYEDNGQTVNAEIENSMADFNPNMDEFHDVENLIINGKVGIGTSTPNVSLAVDGHIRATEVNVLTDVNSVPDYVFHEDYKLLSLEETKDYINENKHLPEVPSAIELSVDGLDLGEMNMLLLKKIEELTLYIIDQDARVKDLEEKIKSIK